jgi:uncharacterized protein
VICPKCQNLMQTVDRRGVHIEQCTGCRGIFLDRGELEQIANAEQSYYAAEPPPYQPDVPPPYGHQGGHPQGGYYRDSPPPHRGGHYGDSPPPYGRHKRRRGFLEELFD